MYVPLTTGISLQLTKYIFKAWKPCFSVCQRQKSLHYFVELSTWKGKEVEIGQIVFKIGIFI
jgi:hypothetical protein